MVDFTIFIIVHLLSYKYIYFSIQFELYSIFYIYTFYIQEKEIRYRKAMKAFARKDKTTKQVFVSKKSNVFL